MIDETVFRSDGVHIIGDNISIGPHSSIWYNSVIRSDTGDSITIGKRTNIQDLCMVHTSAGSSVIIGNGVTIGHSCIIHGCSIGDNTLIGMGSIIMNGARIGSNCIIGAGSLVTEGNVIPDNTMAFGRPARVIRNLTEEEIVENKATADRYADKALKHITSKQ